MHQGLDPTSAGLLLDVVARTVPVVGFDWDLHSNALRWIGEPDTLSDWSLAEDGTGHALFDDVHPEDILGLRRALRDHLRDGVESCDLSHRRRCQQGWRHVHAEARAIRSADGQPVRLIGAFVDDHREIDHAAQLARSARRDDLTGLRNRYGFVEALQRVLLRRAQLGLSAGLLLLDLDRFRSINRALGPEAGDHLLCHVAERLTSLAPDTALVARLGADQFGVLLPPESGCASTLEALADRIVAELGLPVQVGEHEIVTGASLGVLRLDDRWSDAAAAIRDAENALGRAKEGGGGRWSPFVAGRSPGTDRLSLEARLRHALQEGLFHLNYQPIVQLPHRTIVGFEALIRWEDPQLGWVSPGRFIPIAEETGLIVPIGAWVLERACRTLHSWRSHPMGEHLRMNVNLSALQLRQEGLVELVDEVLDRWDLARGHLNLELTETALLESGADQVHLLEQLRALGCQLHIDDFGTGWSSLSNLVDLPVDALKVDRSFVMRAEDDRKSLAVVRMVARMAQEMGLSLTAEGIETEGQVSILNALGRCRGQGYLFAKPLPEDKAFDFLTEPTTLIRQLPTTLMRNAG